jgi:hypothetical protein
MLLGNNRPLDQVFHAADIKFEIKWNYKLLFDIFDELLVEWLTVDEPEKSVTQVLL